MVFKCPNCNKDFTFRNAFLKRHMEYCCYGKKPSKALLCLRSRLKEELNIDVDIDTFCRTYAGSNQKIQGAFIWSIQTTTSIEIGCCSKLNDILLKNTTLEIDNWWVIMN